MTAKLTRWLLYNHVYHKYSLLGATSTSHIQIVIFKGKRTLVWTN